MMINDHRENLCTLNKQTDQCVMYKPILRLYNNGSTNTVESSLPKLKTSKLTVLQRSKQKPCKNICFWFCSNVGVSLFKYETKANYHSKICQNACACIFHILAEHGFLISMLFTVPDIFHLSTFEMNSVRLHRSSTLSLKHQFLQCFAPRFCTHLFYLTLWYIYYPYNILRGVCTNNELMIHTGDHHSKTIHLCLLH